jgi:hypothetical protein
MTEELTQALVPLDSEESSAPSPALLAVYADLPDAVVTTVEYERNAITRDVLDHLRNVRDALAPYGKFKDWCNAVGINYGTVSNRLSREDSKQRVNAALTARQLTLAPGAQLIALTDISPDRRMWARSGYNSETVETLMWLLETCPPILVRPHPLADEPGFRYRYQLIDGFHRVQAAQWREWPDIPALVETMTDDEAVMRCIVPNCQGGMPLTLPQMARWIRRIHADHPDLQHPMDLAAALGLPVRFVEASLANLQLGAG